MDDIKTLIGETSLERLKQVRNAQTSHRVLHEMALYDDYNTLINIPNHPIVQPETLHRLVTVHKNNEINWVVASSNKKMFQKTLDELFVQGDYHIHEALAAHKDADKKLLTKLFQLDDINVFCGLTRNPETSSNMLEAIYKKFLPIQENPDHRININMAASNIINHKNVTPEIAELMVNGDVDAYIRYRALSILLNNNFYTDWPVEWLLSRYDIPVDVHKTTLEGLVQP